MQSKGFKLKISTNSPRLFTPGETKALAKSKVHQLSRAWVTNDVGWVVILTDLKNMADCHSGPVNCNNTVPLRLVSSQWNFARGASGRNFSGNGNAQSAHFAIYFPQNGGY
jgi:hypothetical protein